MKNSKSFLDMVKFTSICLFGFIAFFAILYAASSMGFDGSQELKKYSLSVIDGDEILVNRAKVVKKTVESLEKRDFSGTVYFNDVVDAAVDKGDAKLLIELFDALSLNAFYYSVLDYGYRDDVGKHRLKSMMNLMLSDMDSFSENGKGSTELLSFIGRRMIVYGDYYEAYYFLASAALSETSRKIVYAANVRGLLRHFGCMQDYSKWGDITSLSSFKPSVDPLPELPFDDYFDVAKARRDLVFNGNVPTLQESCPINLYKSEKGVL